MPARAFSLTVYMRQHPHIKDNGQAQEIIERRICTEDPRNAHNAMHAQGVHKYRGVPLHAQTRMDTQQRHFLFYCSSLNSAFYYIVSPALPMTLSI